MGLAEALVVLTGNLSKAIFSKEALTILMFLENMAHMLLECLQSIP